MTPGARVAAAIEVLDRWLAGQSVEQGLTNWARGARYAGAKDRAAVRDHVYDVLRARGSCAHLGGGGDGRALMLGLLRLQGADLEAIFTGIGHAPAALSAAEATSPATPPDPRADIPDWLLPLIAAPLQTGAEPFLAALRSRAPLFLRVNSKSATREEARALLAQDGFLAEADPRAETALVVTSGARQVKASAAYAKGLVEPQDLSVQRAVLAVDWAGRSVLDYCAGGGGKALAVAALGAARVVAHDADPGRMADLPLRAARAGVQIAIRQTADLQREGAFDVVLCDVPCSGSGTWRRDPEAKWRLTPGRLDALLALQAEILDTATRHVVAGGRIVYMTCSLIEAENEGQVARFVSRNPGWSRLSGGTDTPLTASDGFFHAVLQAR